MSKLMCRVHHKNVARISANMVDWLANELTCMGVFECGFVYTNHVRGQFVCLNSNLRWRNQFLEKELEFALPALFKVGVHHLSEENSVKQVYNQSFVSDCFKMCFVFRYQDGFDMFSTSSVAPLTLTQQAFVYRKFRELAYAIHRDIKRVPKLSLDLRMAEAVKEQHALQTHVMSKPESHKALFDDVALTAKEMLYLEYLMVNMTHREIAERHDCTVTAVRAVILNVKKKLGRRNMSCSTMFRLLRDKGVLTGLTSKMMAESWQPMAT